MIPSVSLAVDGSARTFNCVEVVPSTEEIAVPAMISAVGVVGSEVRVGGGISVGGSVDVTKPGIGVTVLALEIFRPQLEQMINTVRMGRIYLRITSLL